jgi:catechol 2,3-dioxygenase-like lactoylglutathione lyase family enzyme
MAHRILWRTVVFDYPSAAHDAALAFWQVALDAGLRRGTEHPEYHVLEHPAALGPVLVQKMAEGPSRFHLDIESDDTEAEVARLVAAGAVELERLDDWVVLRDPAGLLFCVVPATLDQDFDRSAHLVGD